MRLTDLKVFSGDPMLIRFHCTDDLGADFDLTDADEIEFEIIDKEYDGDALLTKKKTETEIVVEGDPDEGRFRLELLGADTEKVEGINLYRIWITVTGDRYTMRKSQNDLTYPKFISH